MIPRTMSTQHPDNVRQPFFVNNSIIAGDEEIKEAFYAFSHLKIREQLWDCEGKEVDNFVVEKLFSRYDDYFLKHKLGKEKFITLRGPNPSIEANQGKILLETLQSIPRNFDIAMKFYGEEIVPIFEIAIPMVKSAEELLRVKSYYDKFVVNQQNHDVHDISVKAWVGEFKPDTINVIPLIEDKTSMLNVDHILKSYIKKIKEECYRVWLARSDPALNYGSTAAILINKIALLKLNLFQEEYSVDIKPIIGCGSVPFRGNFRPDNIANCMKAYPSVHTFTMQSAFKYDYPENMVRNAVEEIESGRTSKPIYVDETRATQIITRLSDQYQQELALIAPLINNFAGFIPQRRKRKLHIGLFGYSRKAAEFRLPRAIPFCATMYSFGIPPELFGLSALGKDVDYVRDISPSFDQDLSDALRYFNIDNLKILPPEIQSRIQHFLEGIDYTVDPSHKKVTGIILEDYKNNRPSLQENIERAAALRNFLG